MDQDFYTRLDAVDWHAMGMPDVPQWIRRLASHELAERSRGYMGIEDNITNAGSESPERFGPLTDTLHSEASERMIPFLFEILRADDVLGKHLILTILRDLAAHIENHLNFERYENPDFHVKPIAEVPEPFRSRAYRIFALLKTERALYQTFAGQDSEAGSWARSLIANLDAAFGDEV